MPEYIIYGGKKITIEEYLKILGQEPGKKGITLADKKPGDIVKLGRFEMIVLDQEDGATYLLKKDAYRTIVKFGENNNFENSNADKICKEFAEELKEIVGSENLLEHTVDMFDNDGREIYDLVDREVSLLSIDGYEEYHDSIKDFGVSGDWWLATPRANRETGVYRVDRFGTVCYGPCFLHHAVRPFCTLKSGMILTES